MGRLCGDSTETVWMQEASQQGGSTGTLGAVQQVRVGVYRQMVCPSTQLLVADNGEDRITWVITIRLFYTDKRLKSNQSDITVVHKDTQECTLIATADCQMTKIS